MSASQPPDQRRRGLLAGLLVLVLAIAIFAAAFLVTHKGSKPAPRAKLVSAKIAPGPDAAKLKKALEPKIAALIKPVVKKKKVTPASTTPAASTPTPEPTYTPAPTYTAPAVTPEPTPAPTPAPKTSTTPHGSGTITVG